MTIQHKFVEFIPDVIEEKTLYISIDYCTAIHKCVCGCGNEVVTPISPTDWELHFDGKTVSLSPSIGNWSFECKSHYFIMRNKIHIARRWEDWEIEEGRAEDKKAKKSYYKKKRRKRTRVDIIEIHTFGNRKIIFYKLMARRKTVNNTGILRVSGIPYHDAWVAYKCVSCQEMNYVQIGQKLITPKEALENAVWKCEHCGFIHSKETDLPFDNWEEEYNSADSKTALRFWEGFFRIATEHRESYWKQCNVCTRILPFSAFSKHSGWGPLEKQMECRSCKGAINAVLNPKRTKEQLHESAVRRRIADLFLEEENEPIDFQDLFKRFDSRCFKTKEPLDINQRDTWAIDHILPSKYLYPLKKENAALLSKNANENKRDKWPSKFYTNNELIDLARITGANIDLISNKLPIMNHNIDVNKGVECFLQVREKSDLPKRIKEIKKILLVYGLVGNLSPENKKLLGFE